MLTFERTHVARASLFLLLLLFAGCSASAGGGGGGAFVDEQRRSVRITTREGSWYETVLSEDRYIQRFQLAATADEVFRQLPTAFQELELDVSLADRESRILGLENVRLRRIGGVRPSRYLSCGQGVGAPNADAYDVFLTLVSQVLASEGGSELQLHVSANARASSVAASAVRCTSTGRLEERFFTTLQESLGD
ncbi:MAG: hypothetical protein GEU90_07850 [Gemmatimonas sp.]|nr:hypothetical protein [Gemmatimonas sp.]